MKLRFGIALLACAALVASGCGGDGDGGKGDGDGAKGGKGGKAAAAFEKDRKSKESKLEKVKKEYEKDDDDIGACRNVAMQYVALASPPPPVDPKTPSERPKDAEKMLSKAVDTLKDCQKIDEDDRDVKQMLATAYMGRGDYDEAADVLGELATSAKGDQRANAFYAWGLASSNAQNLDDAISAWQRFVDLSPKNDPRVPQVKQSIKALQQAQKTQTDNAAKEKDAEK